jgi:hypothetical protein
LVFLRGFEPALAHHFNEAVMHPIAVDLPLTLGRQSIPGGAHVGDQRVGAFIRDFQGIEDCAQGRPLRRCQVGMPAEAGIMFADDATINDLVRNDVDLGIFRIDEILPHIVARLAK